MDSKTIPLEPGHYYHIYNRGNNREILFREKRNYHYFLKLYAYHIEPVTDTFAYCLLPNHFHFLVRIKNLTGLEDLSGLEPTLKPSQCFSNLFNAYTKAFNKAYNRTGTLFQRPFGRIPITSEAYFAQLITYIHQNPQKHRLTADFRQWPYSSYQTLLSDKPTRLKRDEVQDWFAALDFGALHQHMMPISPLTPDDFD